MRRQTTKIKCRLMAFPRLSYNNNNKKDGMSEVTYQELSAFSPFIRGCFHRSHSPASSSKTTQSRFFGDRKHNNCA